MEITEMSQDDPLGGGGELSGQAGDLALAEPTLSAALEPSPAITESAQNDAETPYEAVTELSRRRRSRVLDVGVALPETYGRVVIGEVDEPHRRFSIPISLDQAAMIAMALKALPRRRPLLADVMVDMMNQFSMGIAMVAVTGRQDEVFLAELTVVDAQGRQRNVPIRPSDALLLALVSAVHPPIMVDESLFS